MTKYQKVVNIMWLGEILVRRNKMKKLFNLLAVFLASMMLIGCALEPKAQLLSDSRFNGEFVYSNYWNDKDGIEEKNEYYSYTFDGTSDCTLYYDYSNYDIDLGWSEGNDYNYYKIEIDDSKTHFRLCLAAYTGFDCYEPFGDWSDWKKYEFLDNGNTLRIWDFPEKYPDSYRDFYKE
jgi:hypothetical protein